MTYPDPYFKNVVGVGNLHLKFVFVEYECPILFICEDDKNHLYFCDCVSMNDLQKWLMVPVSVDELNSFIRDEESIINMFLNKEEIYVLTWQYGDQKENCQKTKTSFLTDKDLPPADTYLENANGEFQEWISE